jgi:hypothetical protein
MTEEEWLSAEEPYPLVKHLCQTQRLNRTKAGRRKFWLFGCGCCRRIWNLFESEPASAAVVIAAERYADGKVPFTEVQECGRKVNIPTYDQEQYVKLAADALVSTSAEIVANLVSDLCARAVARNLIFPNEMTRIWSHELGQAACLVRCIFGNPFRPVAFDPAWRTSDVLALAKGIYDDRSFDRMPILADALQDAGCNNDDILNHCRDTSTPHARGCWVVDLVLEKA